jgi:hypothetical protein
MILRCRLWIPACPLAHRPPVFPGPEERWTVGAGAVPFGRVLFPRRDSRPRCGSQRRRATHLGTPLMTLAGAMGICIHRQYLARF